MSGSPPSSVALVTALRWKNGAGVVHTTLVGKLTMQLRDDGRAALVDPEPFVAFDRLDADPRFVAEASELMPWLTTASFVAYGGPLRFTLAREAPQPPFRVELPERPHAGVSMSSPERAALAPRRPTRGVDGVLTIPDDIDGRYFVAAPPAAQLSSLRGDELFALELSGWSTERTLSGMAIEATLQLGPQRRVLALTPDMLVLDVATRKLSIVSRALVRGEAALVSHAVLRIGRVAASDRGDARHAPAAPRPAVGAFPEDGTALLSADEVFAMSLGESDETRDVSAADLVGLANLPSPYVLETERGQAPSAVRLLPATPFDPGFAPRPVQPGVGVVETLTPSEDMARQLDQMRRALRAQPVKAPSAAPGAAPAQAPAPSAPAPEPPRVAPPKAGAMAKPRFKRR